MSDLIDNLQLISAAFLPAFAGLFACEKTRHVEFTDSLAKCACAMPCFLCTSSFSKSIFYSPDPGGGGGGDPHI